MARSLVAVALLLVADLPAHAVDPDYVRDIKPLLHQKCYACHGTLKQKSQLRLDAGSLILKGGRDGPAIVPGKPDESPIIEAVLGRDRPRMPPEGDGERLSEREVKLLRDWIAAGAKMPDEPVPPDPRKHWAYRVPDRGKVPTIKGEQPANPIDSFLEFERRKAGVTPNPPADSYALLRRVYIDLIGIPPTAAEANAFVKDSSPDAYTSVVDRLLASPQYGERWGRHWMDIWRYSDPFGLGEEYRYSQRHIWRWRDWIIESLNGDKGYDRMIVEMLAGDEIAPTDPDTLRATGYLARNWYKFNRNVWIQDTVDYTAAAFLGITLKCARCHDHKYDPFAQTDYYRFRAFFEPHDVRIDPIPGQPDTKKDGVARAFDAKPDAVTYVFRRGDERMPDKSLTMSPAVPAVFAADLAVRPIEFGRAELARALPTAIEAQRRPIEAELAAAHAAVKRSEQALPVARERLVALAKGEMIEEKGPDPFLRDTFAKRNDDLWKVASGTWAWENGKLACKTPSTFATVVTKTNHPQALMGRVRYRTTGGGIGSVGFSYDIAGNSFQAVYINAGKTSAVRPFHRVNGKDDYPSAGVVPHPVNFGDEVTLDFAVRGEKLNTWVNGKLKTVYRLPIPRRAGTFSIWAHDATAEFLEVRLMELPESMVLAERIGEEKPSPLGGLMRTMSDAEAAVRQAESAIAIAERKRMIARAGLDAFQARAAAEEANYREPRDDAEWKKLSLAAARTERRVSLLVAEDAFAAAEKALAAAREKGSDKKTLTAAAQKLAAARKSREAAIAAARKDDAAYTPLVKLDPVGSTGRRLALAKWIADRKNPLTARVAVNHIWMRHFGTPLVATPANFGLSGSAPTHPELLDWLAIEFMESGWSMKKMHRMIVTSQAYRLSSRDAGTGKSADPENRLYWRANPRRMEAEAVRDSLLATAGQLDATMGGPIIDEKQGLTSRRRSIYFRFNTEYKMTFLDQFDPASPTECFERRTSVIPQQGLALLNSSLALNMSRLVAKDLTARAADASEFVEAAFLRVLGRPPTCQERDRCIRFLRDQVAIYSAPGKLTPFPPAPDADARPAAEPKQHAREDLVQVLFNHNDFVTVR